MEHKLSISTAACPILPSALRWLQQPAALPSIHHFARTTAAGLLQCLGSVDIVLAHQGVSR